MRPDPTHADTADGNKPFREKWYFYPVWKQAVIWALIGIAPFAAVAVEFYMSATMGVKWGAGLIGVQLFLGVLLILKAVYEVGFATARKRFSEGHYEH